MRLRATALMSARIVPAMRKIFSLLAGAILFVGCRSYDIVQANVFSDDDGNVVRVAYGRSDKVHVNTFRNPATGKEMDFPSTLLVEVTLPDGDAFTAWQCMNFMPSGTMYKTDNEKWMILVNGFTTMIYFQTKEDPTRYLEVYRGILCDSPNVDYQPNKKWRTLKKDAGGAWR